MLRLTTENLTNSIRTVDLAGTTAECKESMNISYKGIWGYHPSAVSSANTAQHLYLVNRSGNCTSSEGAAKHLDQAMDLCVWAGFRKIVRAKFSAIRIDRSTKRFRTRIQTAFKMDIDFIYPHQNMVKINLDHLIISSCKQRRTKFSVGSAYSLRSSKQCYKGGASIQVSAREA
jgi:hypothetical protein